MRKVGPDYLNSGSKRAVDIAGSIGIGCALSPLAIGALTAAAADNKFSKPFFRDVRIGHRGSLLEITKLRTLPVDADIALPGHGTYDPRASSVGVFLRRFGLDEIPQLANVIGGSMSLIGIRPVSEKSLNQQQMAAPAIFDSWYEAYCAGKPGLVSPGQVHKRASRKWTPQVLEQGMLMDLAYVERASLAGDLKFLGMLPVSVMMSNLRAEISPGESVAISPIEP